MFTFQKMKGIRPQEGPQEDFLATAADIALYGGSAGCGKTYAILIEPLRHSNNSKFGTVVFRRTSKQVRTEGGLWDTSEEIYPRIGARPIESILKWEFKSGSSLSFAHLEHDKNIYDWQGSQIPLLIFDELTHFTEKQFWYMLSRNRSTCGVKPYIRATCNPDADSWVRKLIDWWIDPKTGLAIQERSGAIRWFIRLDDKLIWANSKEALLQKHPRSLPKSFTFIPGKLSDNKILEEADPGYRSNLEALSKIERERLLDGNWNIVASAGIYFQKHYFEEVKAHPFLVDTVRCWDRAATEHKEGDNGDPDWTVGLKLGVDRDNQYYILDVIRERYSSLKVETLTKNTAQQDGTETTIKIFQDPGGAGKAEAENYIRLLSGFYIVTDKVTQDKETLAKPVSAQSEAGNIKILKSCRNKEDLYTELENFPDAKHDDIVDALSGAFNYLNLKNTGTFTKDFIPKDNSRIADIDMSGEQW